MDQCTTCRRHYVDTYRIAGAEGQFHLEPSRPESKLRYCRRCAEYHLGLLQTRARPTGELVRLFLSSTEADLAHEVWRQPDQELRCTCKGFTFHGRCKHVDAVLEEA